MANGCARTFFMEIIEKVPDNNYDIVWYVEYTTDVTEYQLRSLRRIVDHTENFKLGTTNLMYGKDFNIPLNGPVKLGSDLTLDFANCDLVDSDMLEDFLNEFRYYARNAKDLNTAWSEGSIDFTAYICDGYTTPPYDWSFEYSL